VNHFRYKIDKLKGKTHAISDPEIGIADALVIDMLEAFDTAQNASFHRAMNMQGAPKGIEKAKMETYADATAMMIRMAFYGEKGREVLADPIRFTEDRQFFRAHPYLVEGDRLVIQEIKVRDESGETKTIWAYPRFGDVAKLVLAGSQSVWLR
jgi:hypothetical protein